jgi:hypothetical protein
MNGARYHSITLELDPMASDGTYQLKFSTTPGMSTSITELRMGDLDALAGVLGEREGGEEAEALAVHRGIADSLNDARRVAGLPARRQPQDKRVVHHIDGDATNNDVSNLVITESPAKTTGERS